MDMGGFLRCVMLSGLERIGNHQLSLLASPPEKDFRVERLMGTLDAINCRFGRDVLRLAACDTEQPWQG